MSHYRINGHVENWLLNAKFEIILDQEIQPSVVLAPEVAGEMETDLPFDTLRPPEEAVEALTDLQLGDSVEVMKVIHEGEGKYIQAIDEYLKDFLQIASLMVKIIR